MKRLFLLLIVVGLFIGFPSFTNNVSGIVVGTFYVCNFEDYAIGTTYINETVGSDVWLSIEPGEGYKYGVMTGEGSPIITDKYYTFARINRGYGDAYFNLSQNTDFISYDVIGGSSNPATWTFNHYFRRSNQDQVFRILYRDANAGGNEHDFFVYDHADVEQASDTATDAGNSHQINITLNVTTNEIHVVVGNSTIDVWFSSGNFDYIAEVFFDFLQTASTARYMFLDDFYINGDDTDLPLLWDTGDDYSGCVTCDFDGNQSFSFASTDTIVPEIDYKVFVPGLRINQVVLAVSSDSDLNHMESWLRIGDSYNSNRTTYYTYGADYYMIVWENVNTSWFEDEVPLEFKFITSVTSANLYLYYRHSDEDGDGDIQYKYSLDGDNFNGVYDGDVTQGRDLCYEIYYGQGGIFGDVNISVYNESNVSQSISNWAVQIVNKITGVIEYSAVNQSNPLVINTTEYGLGPRLFIIEHEDYYGRTYYADIENLVNYTLDAYLVHREIGQYYCFRVVGGQEELGIDIPLYDARIDITRFINSSEGFINISTLFTDYNGYTYEYLVPGERYYFNITKDLYTPSYSNFIVAANKEDCYEFRLETIVYGPFSWDKWYENISLVAEMVSAGYLQEGNVTVNYTDYNASTINTDTYIYEIYNNTRTYINHSYDTNNTLALVFPNINTTRTHHVVFWYNNTASFIDQISPVVIILDPVHIYRDNRTPFSFDERVKNLFGPFIIKPDINHPGIEIGWHRVVSLIIGLSLLVLLGPYNTGMGIIGAGLGIGLTNGIFALWFTDVFPELLLVLCPLLVVIGIIYAIKSRGEN